MKKTKLIATLGPASQDELVMEGMLRAGMDAARLNFSHGTHAETKARLDAFRAACAELGLNVAALADTKGPEIRLGRFERGSVVLEAGKPFVLTAEERVGDGGGATISYKGLPRDVAPGASILIADGLVELKVDRATDTEIHTTVVNGGEIGNQKSINVPGVHLSMPFISDKDRADLRFIAQEGFDYIAASFTRSAQDVLEMREALHRLNAPGIKIISKIECSEGVENLEAIVSSADALMVARGDLGVEVPLVDIPVLQKRMIKLANQQGKCVVTATQMLESMVKNPRPTRAEVSDVANAIYDGTGAIMLSGETASGAWPVEAVRTMSQIAERTERSIDYRRHFRENAWQHETSIVNAISHATVTTAHDLGAAAILTVTMSGKTALNVSKFRPLCPIIACTTDAKVLRQLALVWGVVPVLTEQCAEASDLFERAISLAKDKAGLTEGNLLVITAGLPLGQTGTTNLLKVHEIGEVANFF